MASLTRSSTVVSSMRHQMRSMNQVHQFSICRNQNQRLLLRNGIAGNLTHNTPLPKKSLPVQQYRTFLVKLARRFPANAPSARTPIPPVEAQTPSPLQLTNLPYFVRRTPSNQLPVYLLTKAAGTKRLTKIQKTEGDLEVLRSDLARALNVESEDSQSKKNSEVTINKTTGHIIVKGWRKDEIVKFLLDRNF